LRIRNDGVLLMWKHNKKGRDTKQDTVLDFVALTLLSSVLITMLFCPAKLPGDQEG
jgi:hypothetical protein